MKDWDRKLNEWVQLQLLSEQQARAIREHEAAKSTGSWFLKGLFLLGAFVIGVGIISLVAANWDQIPASVKLTVDFALLCGAGAFVFVNAQKRRDLVYDGSLAFFLILILASIGLISQIYHTGGRLPQALMFWLAITLPAMLTARGSAIPTVWLLVFGGTYIAQMHHYGFFRHRAHEMAIFASLPLGFLILLLPLRERWKDNLAQAFQIALVALGLLALVFADGFGSFTGKQNIDLQSVPMMIVGGMGLLALAAVFVAKTLTRMQKGLLGAAIAVFLGMAFMRMTVAQTGELLPALLSLACLSLVGLYHVARREEKLFQLYFSLIALRFLVIYFQVIKSLALTGFGLIISGLIIIAIAALWQRYRKVLSKDLERWLNA